METYFKQIIDKKKTPFWFGRQTVNGAKKNFTLAHYHDYIEILYCLEGKFDIHINDDCYHVEQGDLIIINSEDVHSVDSMGSGNNTQIAMHFDPEIIYSASQTLFEIKYILPFLISSKTPQKVFKCSEIAKTHIPDLMKASLAEYRQQSYGYELAIRANICNVFLWILRYWNKSGFDFTSYNLKNPELIPRFQEVLSYLSTHYAEPVTAESMAKMCNLSYSYFSRCFKQLLNRSFSDYLNYIRVSESVKLLITTELNITEIALQVGFSTSSYFIQQFKSYNSVSPKQFRRMISS